jgi:hypothetical protein
MANEGKAGIPSIRSYEDFDVLSGYDGLGREEGKKSTFFTSLTESDAAFEKKADLMGTSGSTLNAQEEVLETEVEKKEESDTMKEEKESSL